MTMTMMIWRKWRADWFFNKLPSENPSDSFPEW